MKIGELWEQHTGSMTGRRGVVVGFTSAHVTLDPAPGSCPCPMKQRRTTMKLWRFQQAWKRVSK